MAKIKYQGLTIWTIGHSNHAFADFLRLLTQHDIQMLADVRRFPGSRTFPHFSREHLSQGLEAAAIEYRWFKDLGGRRAVIRSDAPSPNEGWRNKSFRNYADYMMTATFRSAFDALAEIAATHRTAIVCSESVFWRCHRRLISDYATAMGGSVEHIFPNGQTKPHSITDGAVIEQGEPCQIRYPAEPGF